MKRIKQVWYALRSVSFESINDGINLIMLWVLQLGFIIAATWYVVLSIAYADIELTFGAGLSVACAWLLKRYVSDQPGGGSFPPQEKS